MGPEDETTRLLAELGGGDRSVADRLLPLVYDELRNLASAFFRRERVEHTLQPTALVHEAYLRLVKPDGLPNWNSRGHFFTAAAEAMRRILIDHARQRKSQKRGGDFARSHSNRLMRLRVMLQFIAIIVLMAVLYFQSH